MLPQDDIALKNMLGMPVLPVKVIEAVDALRAFRARVPGGDGPISLDGLAAICISCGYKANDKAGMDDAAVNWNQVPIDTPVIATFHGKDMMGTFKGTGLNGVLQVSFPESDNPLWLQPIPRFHVKIYVPVNEKGQSLENRVEVYRDGAWLPGTEKSRTEAGKVTVQLDGERGKPKSYDADNVRPESAKELATA